MIDNKRQKVIFVNNTKITSEEDLTNLYTLSNKYSNAIFFTERTYNEDNHVDNNIYINGKEYIPVRGIDPAKSVVAIKDKLFIMSLDENSGRIQLNTTDSTESMSLFKIFYTFEYDDDTLNVYDFSDFNPNAYDPNYEYPSDRNNLYNERSFDKSDDNDIHNTICFMIKCVAAKESISPILEGPEINLYYNADDGTKTYLNKYISEFSSNDSNVTSTHRKTVYSVKNSNGQYESYIPYYFKINDYIQLSHSIYAEYEYEYKHKYFTILGSTNVVTPMISNYELVEIPVNNTADYFLYNRSKDIDAHGINENGEIYAIAHIDLSTYTFKILPHRSLYGDKTYYNSLLNNLTYGFNGDIEMTFESSDISFTLQTYDDGTDNTAQLIYDSDTNTITIDKTKNVSIKYKNESNHYMSVVAVPLRTYTVSITYDMFDNTFKNDTTLSSSTITIDSYKITKYNDNCIVYFRQYTDVMDEETIKNNIEYNTTYILQQPYSDELYADDKQVVRAAHRYTIDASVMKYFMIVVDANLITANEANAGKRVVLQDPGVHDLTEQQPIAIGSEIYPYDTPLTITNEKYNKVYYAYDVSKIVKNIYNSYPEVFNNNWVLTVLEK